MRASAKGCLFFISLSFSCGWVPLPTAGTPHDSLSMYRLHGACSREPRERARYVLYPGDRRLAKWSKCVPAEAQERWCRCDRIRWPNWTCHPRGWGGYPGKSARITRPRAAVVAAVLCQEIVPQWPRSPPPGQGQQALAYRGHRPWPSWPDRVFQFVSAAVDENPPPGRHLV